MADAGGLRIEVLAGAALAEALPELARLRIAVFRDWPYLYEGDADYEARYVRAYAESRDAVIVGCFDGAQLVGAATAAPMEDHADAFAAPMAAQGYNLREVLYCGESVLSPAYRGRGVGHAFFDRREAHGRALGRRFSCFCAVIRASDDARRPADYAPLDPFWRKRGYEKLDGVTASYPWREVGGAAEIEHPMQMWIRAL